MTALDRVTEASQARVAAELALDAAIGGQRAAIRAAAADRWRVTQIAVAAGLSRMTVHRVLTAGVAEEQDEEVA